MKKLEINIDRFPELANLYQDYELEVVEHVWEPPSVPNLVVLSCRLNSKHKENEDG